MAKKAIVLFAMIVFLSANICFAKEELDINKFVQQDGTIILFSQDVHTIGLKGDKLSFEVHKVFKRDETKYDAIRIWTYGILAAKHNVVSANLVLDGVSYQLVPLDGAREDNLPANMEQSWYKVTNDLVEKILNTKKASVCINMENGEQHVERVRGSALLTMKYLFSSKDANSPKECTYNYGRPASFRLFFPKAKPTDIGPGLVYKANYSFDGKFNNYRDYYGASYSNDWAMLSLEYINCFFDKKNTSPFLTVEMKEETDGTWVKVDVLEKERVYNTVTQWGMTTTYLQAIYYPQIRIENKLEDSELCELDNWASRVMSLYEDLCGEYDYGLTWNIVNNEKNTWKKMRKAWSVGPYDVEKVNKDKFEELREVNNGDKIIAINGEATDKINYPNSIFATKYSGSPVVFTIRTSSGAVKEIKVTPRFVPSSKSKTDYLKLMKENSGQFTNNYPENGETRSAYMTYDPLGKRDF